MKKRLLPILLALALVCALPTWAAFVTSGDVTSPLLSTAWADPAEGENSTEGEGPAPAQVTFTEVTNETALKEAVAAGKSVKLMQDIVISSRLEVKNTLTLDLNNCELKRVNMGQYGNAVIQVYNNATLTIQDSALDRTTRTYTSIVDQSKEVTTTGGVITGGRTSGVYLSGSVKNSADPSRYEYTPGYLIMTGGTIVGCMGSVGGGVRIEEDSAFTMSGTARITDCFADGDGGGVQVYNGTFTMSGTARITDCSAGSGGGGVELQSGGAFIMLDGEISNCTAPKGGGVYGIGGGSSELIEGVHGTFTMKGGKIYGCTATLGESYGGAIYMDPNNMFAHGGEVEGSVGIHSLDNKCKGIWHIDGEGYTIFNGTIYAIDKTIFTVQYPITYDLNNGSGLKAATVTLNSPLPQPETPVWPGYEFTGWTVKVTGKETVVNDFVFGSTPVTKPLTLTAEWTEAPVQNRYYYYAASADTKPDDTKRSSPKTADPGVILYGAAALLSLTGMAALTGRKK